MKTFIAAAIVATLSTPALADKQPVDNCSTEVSYAMIMYHLDRIQEVLDKMEENELVPKPVDNDK